MIYSDRQYYVSQTELAKLKAALFVSENATANEDDAWVRDIEIDALRSQIADIEAEIAEYELLKSGQVTFSETCSLSELPRVLIQARIARGLSQTDLADQLNMKPQQIQRYEASDYMGASLARLIEVAAVLDVKISESFETKGETVSGSVFAWTDPKDVAWSRLPIREMIKRNWLEVGVGENAVAAARRFFLTAAGSHFATALHRKKVRSGSVPNEFSLLAWQARVLSQARNIVQSGSIAPFTLDERWLPDLIGLTREENGPAKARSLLADRGIVLIVERHLPGTYLDGAAMLADSGHPIVALTLRHDRLDNFWFVLLHELGHVFLHLFESLRFDFFDEEDGAETDDIERAADRFALDSLVPAEIWEQCLSRFAMSEDAVRIDAERLNVDASIIAGRIRKERNNYTIFNDLIGRGLVRFQFGEVENENLK